VPPPRAVYQRCLFSDLADMGLHRCHFVAQQTDTELLLVHPYNAITTNFWPVDYPFHVTNIWSKSCGVWLRFYGRNLFNLEKGDSLFLLFIVCFVSVMGVRC